MTMFGNSIADFLDDEKKPTVVTPRMTRWVKNSCVYRLNQKMMSEKQLFDALVRKARTKFDDMDAALARKVAQAGIDFCNDNSFLDDNAFAKVKASSGLRSGKSRRRIAMDLNRKGVDPEVIQASLQGIDDVEAAINFARKKAFGPFRKVDLDERRKAKEFSAFARNGYAASLTMRLLHMARTEVDDVTSNLD